MGAAISFFLDPQQGRRRRAITRDRTTAMFRRTFRRAEGMGRGVRARTHGLKQRVTHLVPEDTAPNDPTLAQKVRSDVLRGEGHINVNVEDGIVVLRGEIERPERIRDIEAAVRKIHGVRDVRNMLHLPGTPAQMQTR